MLILKLRRMKEIQVRVCVVVSLLLVDFLVNAFEISLSRFEQHNYRSFIIPEPWARALNCQERNDSGKVHTFCTTADFNPLQTNASTSGACGNFLEPCFVEAVANVAEDHVFGLDLSYDQGSFGGNLLFNILNDVDFEGDPVSLLTSVNGYERLERVLATDSAGLSTVALPTFAVWSDYYTPPAIASETSFYLQCWLESLPYALDSSQKYCCWQHVQFSTSSEDRLQIEELCVDIPSRTVSFPASVFNLPRPRTSLCDYTQDSLSLCFKEWFWFNNTIQTGVLSPSLNNTLLNRNYCMYACKWPCFSAQLSTGATVRQGCEDLSDQGPLAHYLCRESGGGLHTVNRVQVCNQNVQNYVVEARFAKCTVGEENLYALSRQDALRLCVPGEVGCQSPFCRCPARSGCKEHPFCHGRGTLFESSTGSPVYRKEAGFCVCEQGYRGQTCQHEPPTRECHFSQHFHPLQTQAFP